MKQTNIRASFCLLCYNQEDYILEAIEGALRQTYIEMEIIISDDCSTDNTFKIIESRIEKYSGPHNIILNRNETNIGLVPHINKVVFELASADIIVLAAGDDISLPERVEQTVQLFDSNPMAMQVTASKKVIDETSKIISSYEIKTMVQNYDLKNLITAKSFMVGGGASAYRRKVFTFFGPLNLECPTEDSTLRNRSLLLGKLYQSADIWYYYRIHSNNISSPNNIFNLRHEQIASQYKADIEVAMNKEIISVSDYRKLLHKVDLYLLIHGLRERAYLSKSAFIKRIIFLELRLISCFQTIFSFAKR